MLFVGEIGAQTLGEGDDGGVGANAVRLEQRLTHAIVRGEGGGERDRRPGARMRLEQRDERRRRPRRSFEPAFGQRGGVGPGAVAQQRGDAAFADIEEHPLESASLARDPGIKLGRVRDMDSGEERPGVQRDRAFVVAALACGDELQDVELELGVGLERNLILASRDRVGAEEGAQPRESVAQ